jgi:hypothetical protein
MYHVRGTSFERASRMLGGASSFFVNSVAMKRAGRGIAPIIRRWIAGGALDAQPTTTAEPNDDVYTYDFT